MLNPVMERQIADWMSAHNVREICPMCDQAAPVDHTLFMDGGDMATATKRPYRFILHRTCTVCGAITYFDAMKIGLISQSDYENKLWFNIVERYSPSESNGSSSSRSGSSENVAT